jgi:hypothetical protein
MTVFLVILKFLASFIAISSTLLYLGNYINAINAAKALFNSKEESDSAQESAKYRIKLGLIMAVSWSIVIAL